MRDRRVLVVGASSGIGAAMTRAFAGAGARVVAAGRRMGRLEEIASRSGGPAGTITPLTLDVADEASARAGVAAAAELLGGLDVVVNNAGVMLNGLVQNADPGEWERMTRTNLLGTLHVSHAALPHLVASRGTLVQTSSTSGRTASAGSGVYAATKHGVNAFSEALRQEVAPQGVRVVVVEPGMVDTELASHLSDTSMRDLAARIAGEMRILDPQDVADAVLFAVTRPPHVSINEILIRPTGQAF
ncbi:SDR family NAD(P)-dependent oxidoreductase [Isoptericola sp. 4D.3]|uniref:SDR family NAD(P)-dependent oxidoreductase n=1 Tax=Isoptericola peretonis TaxID=2918523 RepID=A0ABT0J1Q7_9MICO|nr:SDR family NAD(P)-dependent oxidoreductase [Isoptericola sp. 4D.3]